MQRDLNLRYRRADIKGGTYFFTINLAERRLSLLTDHIHILRGVINQVKNRHPFVLDAMVVLPDQAWVCGTGVQVGVFDNS